MRIMIAIVDDNNNNNDNYLHPLKNDNENDI